ncbi:hypothetical protein J4732_17400 [Serratia marcescens]|uniref:Uncharacterized protein n=1 Tax=Serratia marcescens TaxID=615 RepID=A0A939NT92_SERMA|nr:hypothetical protein [Serratia marcescens]
MADQVHQHGLCLMGKPDKGRRWEPGRRAALHRRLQDLLCVRRPCA